MSKSGTYIYNKETGQMEKVSDRIPSIKNFVYFPRTGKYYCEGLGKTFESKQEKRKFMAKKGYAEA